ECFVEKFHRHTYNGENSGALGVVAPSEVSYSFVNDAFVWGLYDNMWPDFLPTYNSTPVERGVLPAFGNAAGKYFLQQSSWPYNTNNKAVTYALFHHHGDAFTTIYSEVPQDLTVVHDPILLSGVSTFNVTANAGALIAMSVEGELIGVAEGTGSPVSVIIDPQVPPTDIDLVITMQNYYRYEVVIPVIPPNGPYVVYDSHEINDASGNGNGMLDYSESVTLDFTVSNVGSDIANDVDVTILSTDVYVTITDATANFGNIAAGATATVNDAFEFEVADDVPDGHVIAFIVEADGGQIWESYFSIEVLAPILAVEEFIIDDATGNNNGRFDPGETVTVYIPTMNEGSSTSPSAIGTLTCAEPLITIVDETYTLGEIVAGGSIDAVYTVTADPGISVGTPLNFVYEVIAGEYSLQNNFGAVVGLIVEDFETNNFETFEWQFGGNANWIISTDAYEGSYSATSGNISDNQTSSLYLEVNVLAAGELSFYKKVSSEANYDYLRFFVDNNEMDSWAGDVSWSQETYTILAGEHTLKWEYEKDYSVSSGSDCGWIDYIIFPPIGIEPIGIVAGDVTDIATGSPIENADIEGLAVSGPDGSYSFEILEGTYDLTCTADGYYELTIEDVLVTANQTTTVDFAMEALTIPEGLSCTVVDYNDVELIWNVPEITRSNPEMSQTKSISRNIVNTKQRTEQTVDYTRDITGYKVYRAGVEIAEITDPALLTYTDLALDGGDYEYYITAVHDMGESLPSNMESVTITLPVPQNPEAVSQGEDIFVSWDVPANRSLSHYKVYRNLVMIAEDVLDNFYLDLSVPNGTYTYNIRAIYSGDYQSALSSDAVIEHVQTNVDGIIVPVKTELTGNYPNPFNPTTTISFSTKKAGHVSINIYNMKGQLVKTLVNEQLEAAYHDVVWNGKDNSNKSISSGIYFYKMRSSNYTATKKMILMK
nr:carboxypeptidase regulatory-like domain-containing protein [Candidatus Cloacimonadota bacterium]